MKMLEILEELKIEFTPYFAYYYNVLRALELQGTEKQA